MDTILMNFKLIAVSLVGMFIMLLSKSQDMETTAKKANIVYPGFWSFIKTDIKGVGLNLCAIIATHLIFGDLINAGSSFLTGKTYHVMGIDIPYIYVFNIFMMVGYFATGYFGQDFILRKIVKSVQNKLIKQTIDEKTTLIDRQNGTEDKPTPLAENKKP